MTGGVGYGLSLLSVWVFLIASHFRLGFLEKRVGKLEEVAKPRVIH